MLDTVDGDDRGERAKRLLAVHPHLRVDAEENRRRVAGPVGDSAGQHLRSVLAGILDKLAHVRSRGVVDQRPDLGLRVTRIPDTQRARAGREQPREGLRLAAEFEQRALEVASGQLRDDPPDAGRAREVHATRVRMGDQLLDDVGCVLGLVGEEVDHAGGSAGVGDRGGDVSVRARAQLRGL